MIAGVKQSIISSPPFSRRACRHSGVRRIVAGMVAILLIGDEILSADVREANLHLMLSSLSRIGYQAGEVRIVRDEIDEIASAFRALRRRYDYVFSAGGIGPTHDDKTLQAVAAAFDTPVATHPEMLAFLKERYGDPLSPMVARMADLPEETEVLGCAEGRWPLIRWNNVFILPGLPRALADKMERIVTLLPPLDRSWSSALYLSEDESVFADWLGEMQSRHPEVSIGSYPVVGDLDYRTRLVVRGVNRAAVDAAVSLMRRYVMERGWLVRDSVDSEDASR